MDINFMHNAPQNNHLIQETLLAVLQEATQLAGQLDESTSTIDQLLKQIADLALKVKTLNPRYNLKLPIDKHHIYPTAMYWAFE
jgi:hypothetical protein